MGKIPQDCIFVTADVVGLDPIIPHNTGLEALKDRLDCGQKKTYILICSYKLQNLLSLITILSWAEFFPSDLWNRF